MLNKVFSKAILFTLFFALVGCGIEVPEDKKDYIGIWKGHQMYLEIKDDGKVEYKRVVKNATTTISAPLKAFEGDNFTVGLLFLTTTFNVQQPPYKDGTAWKMVVDGVELVRSLQELRFNYDEEVTPKG